MVFINKFARHCPINSRMRLLTVQKFKFSGPDPPLEPVKPDVEEVQEEAKAPPAKGKKEEAPVEVELTEEEKAELKLFDDFVEEYLACMEQVKGDICEYRQLARVEGGVERVALWPKTFSPSEIKQI